LCTMSRLIFVLAVAIASAAAFVPPMVPEMVAELMENNAPKAGKACDTTVLMRCTMTYIMNFGLNQIPTNESYFEAAFFGYINVQGVDGWRQVRNWTQALQMCVGGMDNFNACYDWNVLMPAWSLDAMNAKMYNVRFLSTAYDVGPGYDVLRRDWYCIQGVYLHEGPVVAQCWKHFQDQNAMNPNMTCQHLTQYLVCIDRPFTQHCGREAGALVCMGERIAYLVYAPDCASHVELHCRGGFAPARKNLLKKKEKKIAFHK